MQHTEEIRAIVNKYALLEKEMKVLEERTKMLFLKKQELEFNLLKIREEERTLIDKIKRETGKTPDFYAILQELKCESETIN